MKIYLVGGAVRDHVLGRDVNDRDYVVVGATADEMLAAGFRQVGADFPVFLHPETGEEYALARTERKSGVGYHGFTVTTEPTVTLEEDLARRDLTVNSMAMDMATYEVIDPHGGLRDLGAGVLRHTSEAFADDPLRVLRLARFTARFPTFTVAPETAKLCKAMVHAGDLQYLTQERVWVEVHKALAAGSDFGRFYQALDSFHAFDFVPALKLLSGVPSSALKETLSRTAGMHDDLRKTIVVGALIHFGRHSLADANVKGLPAAALRVKELLGLDWLDMRPTQAYERLLRAGALRGGWDFVRSVVLALDPQAVEPNQRAVAAASKVTAAAYPGVEGKQLGDMLRHGRIDAIQRALSND